MYSDIKRRRKRTIRPVYLVICAVLALAVLFLLYSLIALAFGGGPFAPRGSSAPVVTTATPGDITPSPSPTPTAAPTPTPTPSSITINVRVAGDIMVHDNQLISAKKDDGTYDFKPYFEDIAPVLANADLTIANLETALGGPDIGYSGYPLFSTPDSLLDALKMCGIDVLTTANNHTLDKGLEGSIRTVEKVREAGFYQTGSSINAEDSDTILIVDVQGIKIAILAYSYGTNYEDNNVSPAIPADDLKYAYNKISKDRIIADAKKARQMGADIVMASLHWGIEYERTPSQSQRELAQDLIEQGVDVILGSHPHVVQKITYKDVTNFEGATQKSLVAYSLGNFISDQRAQYRDSGIILDITLKKDMETGDVKIIDNGYIPVYVFREDKAEAPFQYRLLPVGKVLADDAYKSQFTDTIQTKIQSVWDEIKAVIGTETSKILEE